MSLAPIALVGSGLPGQAGALSGGESVVVDY